MRDPKKQIDYVEDVIQHGLNFCEAAMPSKDFDLYAKAVRESWDAIKQRLGAIRVVNVIAPSDVPGKNGFLQRIHIEVETDPDRFVTVLSTLWQEIKETQCYLVIDSLAIRRAIEAANG